MVKKSPDKIRINKFLADKGVASRREIDTLIEKGLVTVNGKKAVIGQQVNEEDAIEVKTSSQTKKSYLAYYKGRGIITHSPDHNQTDIATQIKEKYGLTNIYPIGRLDKDSEGLMLLTNDGRLNKRLLNPEAGHEREYDVTVDKPIPPMALKKMAKGLNIEGYKTKPAQTRPHATNRYRFNITLTEGKKHQIRRMCASLGFQVQSLKRVRIMHIELGKLKPNQFRKLTKPEQTQLLQKLGLINTQKV